MDPFDKKNNNKLYNWLVCNYFCSSIPIYILFSKSFFIAHHPKRPSGRPPAKGGRAEGALGKNRSIFFSNLC